MLTAVLLLGKRLMNKAMTMRRNGGMQWNAGQLVHLQKTIASSGNYVPEGKSHH
jgi:hypothetical protein